jgi:hypothetical protein
MKNTKVATIYPKEKNGNINPISINHKEGDVVKVTKFFRKVVNQAIQEKPPRIFKQIIFFYEGGDLKYLKPFNL